MELLGDYGNPGGRDAEVATVGAVYDAFARRDLEAVVALMDEDVELRLAGTQARLGRTEPYRGHAGVRQYLVDAAKTWDELQVHPGHMRAAAGGVVVFGKVIACEDGERVSRRAVWTWRLRDGKVMSVRADDLGESVPSPAG